MYIETLHGARIVHATLSYKSIWNYIYSNTLTPTHIDPSCSLHKAKKHILYWIGTAKTMVPKKVKTCGNRGRRVWTGPCLDNEEAAVVTQNLEVP